MARRPGRCACLTAVLATLALSPRSIAMAHGEPPTAHSVIASDAEGPLLVKLGTGFAQRRGQGRFQFVCPALWGGETAAPAAALGDGTVVIGANRGLMLLAADGRVSAHPDPHAQGASTELVRSAGGVFVLRYLTDHTEVARVDAAQVGALWTDTGSWYSLGALDTGLLLVRANGTTVEQLTLSFEGKVIDRQQAAVPTEVDYSFARGAGSQAFVLLLVAGGPELGRLGDGGFERVARAASSIAGPLSTPDGLVLAVDGQLEQLRDAGLSPWGTDSNYFSCLEQDEHGRYACTRDGVVALGDAGAGRALFALTSLVPPDSAQLSDEVARGRCDYQWQDLRFDLIALGKTLTFDGDGADAGGAVERDAGALDAAVVTDAGQIETPEGAQEAGAATLDAGGPVHAKHADGCSLASGSEARGCAWFALVFAGAVLRSRRRRELYR